MASKTKTILVSSFCLNAILAAAWFMNRTSPVVVVQKNAETNLVSAPVTKKSRAGRSVSTITVNRETALDWRSVESEDYRAYIENLRAIGCPEETVRDIIIADVNKLYASKIAGLYPTAKDFKFWRVQDRLARNEEKEREKKSRDFQQEKRELLRELLGIDYEAEMARLSGKPSDEDLRYGFLSPEKQEQVKALREKYHDLERAVFKGGEFTAESRAKFMALRAERELETATLLGPEDFEEYQLRTSRTARNMRENLSGFEPSEEEFRQIFQARKTFDDQFAFTREGGDEVARAEKKAAEAKLDEQMKSLLGDERYHDYKLAQDDRFKESFDFAQRYNLPKEKAQMLYEVRLAAENQLKRIQNDPNLSPELRVASMQAIANDTKTTLSVTLTPDIYKNYLSRSGGWLNKITTKDSNSGNGRNRGDRADHGSNRRGK
ncbi:MAG: hypothetical protein ABI042_12550 [Verrucomicrobiota bacterium]